MISISLAFVVLRPLTRLVNIPGQTLVPFLLLFLSLGAYSSSNNFADVLVMLLFGAIGMACIHWRWPRVPLLLGSGLGEIAERYFFLSYSLFDCGWLAHPADLHGHQRRHRPRAVPAVLAEQEEPAALLHQGGQQ